MNAVEISSFLRRVPNFIGRQLTGLVRLIDPMEWEFQRIWPHLERVEGLLVSPMQDQWLFEAARTLRDGATIVEIGSYKGRSTCCLAYGCRGTTKHVFAIDSFEGNETDFPLGIDLGGGKTFDGNFYEVFRRNLETNGLTPYVTPISGVSWEVGAQWTRPIDFLFLDGSHEYDAVLRDFETFFPHVVPGGLVAFHDVAIVGEAVRGFPGVFTVWQDVAAPQLRQLGRCNTLTFGRKPPLP